MVIKYCNYLKMSKSKKMILVRYTLAITRALIKIVLASAVGQLSNNGAA